MKIIPCDGPFGVEIHDLDLRNMSDKELQACQQAQRDHGVIFFRDQKLDRTGHIEAAKRFGEIVINRFFEADKEHPEIAWVRKEPTHKTAVGEAWHTDHSYDVEPAKGSILYARELPSKGGDTHFINMHRVYASLSEGLKKTLLGLNAVHSSRHAFGYGTKDKNEDRFLNHGAATQDALHPMVIAHPESGKSVLYVNGDFTTHIEGWSKAESDALLNYLYAVAKQPENVLVFKWQQDSIAFWDNRAVWHSAQNDYPGERRFMHRITLSGCALDRATL